MPRPVRHVVSATSAADFDQWMQVSDPAWASDPVFLAEGDSWFNKFYPTGDNLLDQLDLPRGCRVIDHSWSGDRALDMFGRERLAEVQQYLDLVRYQAILLSAGGNDIIAGIGELLDTGTTPVSLDAAKVAAKFAEVEGLVRAFCQARSNSTRNAATRVFIHAYDFVVPRAAPVKGGLAGPWVLPRLAARGVTDPAAQAGLVRALLIAWLARLTVLAEPSSAEHIPGFHLLVSHGLLAPARHQDTGRSGDWEDEIHPTKEGYRKLARALFNPVMRAVLAGG